MSLRDTSWMWNGTAPVFENANLVDGSSIRDLFILPWASYKRQVTEQNYEWIAVTKDAAVAMDSRVTNDLTATNRSVTYSEVNRVLGEYVVKMTVKTVGAWTLDT